MIFDGSRRDGVESAKASTRAAFGCRLVLIKNSVFTCFPFCEMKGKDESDIMSL